MSRKAKLGYIAFFAGWMASICVLILSDKSSLWFLVYLLFPIVLGILGYLAMKQEISLWYGLIRLPSYVSSSEGIGWRLINGGLIGVTLLTSTIISNRTLSLYLSNWTLDVIPALMLSVLVSGLYLWLRTNGKPKVEAS